ncbi:TetR/AcrR family transcriptional regulator [Crenobacter cavernae]|uniref:TetR/AcrR family transcriptional regulator n=2 Tax=Crenobacter cavernae TaxID=2290923 RepID=A0ABY0FC94_9NEIS|nr:TetR/AcrR family transcriptional regulator [Crenobacter cavernae]
MALGSPFNESEFSNAMIDTGWQRKKDERPGEILDAALDLFVEKGFRATKMEDIARAAGVTKGTPYLYFENKEELFKAVVRETQVAHVTSMRERAAGHSGSATELLFALLEDWWKESGSTRLAGLCKLMMAEATNFPELAAFYYAEVIAPSRAMMTSIVEFGVARGEFRPLDVAAAVDALMAPIITSMVWNHSFGAMPGVAPVGRHDYASLMASLSLLLNGLTAR